MPTNLSTSGGEPLIGVAADFNSHNFCRLLERNTLKFRGRCGAAPFGQTLSVLHSRDAEFWQTPWDAVVIWTLPQLTVPEFSKALDWKRFSLEQVMAEVDSFASLVEEATASIPSVILPTWELVSYGHGLGSLEMQNQLGVTNTLMRMNLRLADRFESSSRVILLYAQPWQQAGGLNAFSPRLWYRSKTPFQNEVFEAAAQDVAAVVAAGRGLAKKIVVVDLDNTLWGGEVGDVGWENLRIGGHDAIGEAYVDFQRVLKRLTERGILLAISSKNEESVALAAIEKHPEMILRLDDFVGWRINWNDKAQNIAEMLTSLNLGIDSAVFLDDSPFERSRVREAFPTVLVPELPQDPLSLGHFVQTLRCFDNPVLSQEDRTRTALYVADRKRVATKMSSSSLREWLLDLGLKIHAKDLEESDVGRVLQLFQRTNQMNLSTRRFSRGELEEWLQGENRSLWTFRVADRFGDYGFCGVASVEEADGRMTLRDFLVSCRVLGRGVEETMLAVAAQHAAAFGYSSIHAHFVPTAKNTPCEKWCRERPSATRDGNVFAFDVEAVSLRPIHVGFDFNPDAKNSVPSPV